MEMTFGPWQIAIQRTRPTETELRHMYDTGAARWHRSIENLGYLKAYADLFERLRTAGPLRDLSAQARILDGGIGTGALSLSLAGQFGTGLQVDGVDLSPGMLEKAQKNSSRIGLRLKGHCRSAQNLEFADDVFDLTMSAHMLEHAPDPQATLHELVRVLRPGAPLVLVVSKPGFYTGLIQLRWRYAAYKPDQVIQFMRQAGLTGVNRYEFGGGLPGRTSVAYVGIK